MSKYVSVRTEVEVDVDMDDFEDDELVEELECRGYTVIEGGTDPGTGSIAAEHGFFVLSPEDIHRITLFAVCEHTREYARREVLDRLSRLINIRL